MTTWEFLDRHWFIAFAVSVLILHTINVQAINGWNVINAHLSRKRK